MKFTVCGYDKDQYVTFCQAVDADSAGEAVKLIEAESRSPDDVQIVAVFRGDVMGLLVDQDAAPTSRSAVDPDEVTALTAADLLALLLDISEPIPGDAVLHLSVQDLEYAPIVNVVHEPSDDGPGVLLFEIDSDSAVAKLLQPGNYADGRFADAISGLTEYYPCLKDADVQAMIRRQVRIEDSGNAQADYEKVRDQVEALASAIKGDE